MKLDSDNFRDSAAIDILSLLKKTGATILIYEPLLLDPVFDGLEVYADLDKFKSDSEIILSNRYCDDLADVKRKVFTRDIFGES
jgi:UDPglucose 6-dehydrogenase